MKTYQQIQANSQNEARQELREGLALCTLAQQRLFKLMYARDEELSIAEVVDRVPEKRLDWAMKQVQGTLDKAQQPR